MILCVLNLRMLNLRNNLPVLDQHKVLCNMQLHLVQHQHQHLQPKILFCCKHLRCKQLPDRNKQFSLLMA